MVIKRDICCWDEVGVPVVPVMKYLKYLDQTGKSYTLNAT
jgi:hypothetical protein